MRISLALSLLLAATAAQAQPDSVARDCERTADAKVDISDQRAFQKYQKDWLEICERAIAIDGGNPRVQVALARAYSSTGRQEAAVKLYRAAAAQDNAEAWHSLYERYKSYERGDVNKPQLVTRAEAEQGLRKAAELGHPYATMMLATLLDRGGTVKRDPVQAIYWAAQALTRASKDSDRGSLLMFYGRLLAKSANPDERARGIKILEGLSNGRGDAKAELAKVIRAEDPVRARKLLEDTRRSHSGYSLPLLTEMLIKGEGGPKDEKRAVSLLAGGTISDAPSVLAARGRLMVEGRLVPRDLQKGVGLIDHHGRWDYDARLEVMRLLAANPGVTVSYPGGLLYDATEAIELGEPGAMAALIELKLSGHVQFGDKAGGCALVAKAANSGDPAAAKHAAQCAN